MAGQAARSKKGPTTLSPKPPGLASVLARNIRKLQERRRREEVTATIEERIAGAITRFSGTMRFVYVHVVWFGADRAAPNRDATAARAPASSSLPTASS